MATVQTMHYTLIIVMYTPELVQKYHICHSQTPLEKERKRGNEGEGERERGKGRGGKKTEFPFLYATSITVEFSE